MVYKCFSSYLLCFWVFLEYLQVQECFGDMWWFWGILEIKLQETRSYPSNQSRVDIQSHTSIDEQLFSLIDSEARKVRLGSQPANGPNSASITKIPLANFNLIFMWFVIVFGQHMISYFILFTEKHI